MKNRIWALLLCVHCLGVAAFAQMATKPQVVLQVSNGGSYLSRVRRLQLMISISATVNRSHR
jgi:hypothetical protein